MTKLLSFHGKQETKDFYMQRLEAHAKADEIIQGVAWENGKGCAVGCTLHNYSHSAYEKELGIPRILAKLEDRIFEGLAKEEAKNFPIKFLSAIPVNADLSNVFKEFLIWLLTDPSDGVIKFAKTEKTKQAIQDISDLLKKSLLENVTYEQFMAVRRVAAAAADAAAAAAADADAAAAAYAAAAADAAAAAAAYAAAAAAAAAYAAADADAAAAAAADARQSHYKKMGDKLIELLAAAPVLEVAEV